MTQKSLTILECKGEKSLINIRRLYTDLLICINLKFRAEFYCLKTTLLKQLVNPITFIIPRV